MWPRCEKHLLQHLGSSTLNPSNTLVVLSCRVWVSVCRLKHFPKVDFLPIVSWQIFRCHCVHLKRHKVPLRILIWPSYDINYTRIINACFNTLISFNNWRRYPCENSLLKCVFWLQSAARVTVAPLTRHTLLVLWWSHFNTTSLHVSGQPAECVTTRGSVERQWHDMIYTVCMRTNGHMSCTWASLALVKEEEETTTCVQDIKKGFE